MSAELPLVVQAQYAFKGKNNDELNFKKGDIITITQKDEGGWWEGTFEGKTGWFPSNYVKEYKVPDNKLSLIKAENDLGDQQKMYRSLILKDIVESERNHVLELQNLMKTVLIPLESTEILTKQEYGQLIGSLGDVIELHVTFLKVLEECFEKPVSEQRVGRIFLSMAERMKIIHTDYCSNHPKAVCILESHKEKLGSFVEALTNHSPGLVYLTAGLSRPFRRLERYAGCLQELERHMEEFHVDRGDTQRSVFLYQSLAASCSAVRRQKEQELEVLSGSVRNWEGDEPHRLGELLYMGAVKLASSFENNAEITDRYLVLFSQCIIFLSVSQRLSAFVFERKLPLSGLTVNVWSDSEFPKFSFELIGSCSERLIVGCSSKEEMQRLVELIQKQLRCTSSSIISVTPYITQHTAPSAASQPLDTVRSPPPTTKGGNQRSVTSSLSGQGNQPYLQSHFFVSTPSLNQSINKIWTWSCLRPSSPLRPCPVQGRDDRYKKTSKSIRKKELNYEDDLQLLQVVEGYCLSAKARQIVKSALLEHPQVLIAEEEKIIVEESSGNETVMEEKSLVDTVYALRDQVRELQNQLIILTKDVELMKLKTL